MTLQELSAEYQASAELLTQRLRALRQQLRAETDAEQCWQLQQRIRRLQQLRQDTNALANLLAHYYEGGYYRSDSYTVRLSRREMQRRAQTRAYLSGN